MKRNIAAVPHPEEPPKKKRERLEARAAEARLFRFLRGAFRNLEGGVTWRERQQLREDAHREVNLYFDAKVGRR